MAKLQSNTVHLGRDVESGRELSMCDVLLIGLLVAGLVVPSAASAETAQSDDVSNAFQFELAAGGNPYRGPAVEGYLRSELPWRITNVRLRVESVDASGRVTGVFFGWVLGDVRPGDRGYFYVPVSSPAASYRASVESFNRVSIDTPTPEAP